MNERSDFDRVLTHWFDDGPSTMPDRVVEVVADRIGREGQRRAWRLDRRPLMNPAFKAMVGLAAALAVAVAGWSLLPKSPDGSGNARATSTLAPTRAPSSSEPGPSPTLQVNGVCDRPLSTCRGQIEPGTYTSRGFTPALTFTVPEPEFWFNTFDRPHGFGLTPWNAANRAAAGAGQNLHTTIELWRDLAVTRADCVEEPEPGVGPSAGEIIDALHDRPGVRASEPVAVEVGGLAGYSMDLQLSPDWIGTCPQGPGPGVPLVVDPRATPGTGLHWGVGPDERFRIFVLDVGERGETVLISIWSDSAEGWDDHLAASMAVVESFSFAD